MRHIRILGVALGVLGCGTSPNLRPSPPDSHTGSAPSGNSWDYRYDRNALTASVAVGSHLIALTEAGHVLRFDRHSLALTGEWLSPRMARAVAASTDREVIVGFEGGQIARLEVATMSPTRVGLVPGVPAWIGRAPSGEMVVVYGRRTVRPFGWARGRLWGYRVRWLSSGREIDVESASAFLADSVGRLWLGADHGEWGGGLQMVDLSTGALQTLAQDENVYGIFEPTPGTIWIHGGVVHMMLYRSFISQVTGRARNLSEFDSVINDEASQRAWRHHTRPRTPVTHLVRASDDKILALSYEGVFETDDARRFIQIAELHVAGRSGRPDAVGSYPAVRAIDIYQGRITLATGLSGYAALENGSIVSHALPGQLAFDEDRYFRHDAADGTVSGSDDVVGAVVRDEQGRTWLGGRGLWYVGADGRALAVRGLPFVADTDVLALAIEGSRLRLNLGARGIASISLTELRALVGGSYDLDIDQWASRQPHEPKYGDGAVLVKWRDRSPYGGPEAVQRHQLTKALWLEVAKSRLTCYPADEREPYSEEVLLMYTPEPVALAEFIARTLKSDPLASKIEIRTRKGPPGAPWSG